ncbi:MAG: hypothetical protein R2702_06595 [Acidimicrobiales bacterium]
MEGLLLRGRRDEAQLTLDLGLAEKRDELHQAWESAAEREKQSQTKYSHQGIRPDEVAREVTAIRAALGSHQDVATFTVDAPEALAHRSTTRPPGHWP